MSRKAKRRKTPNPKAWPSAAKAKILIGLGRYDEAYQAIQQGRQWLFEGWQEEYPAEIRESKTPQEHEALMKLGVWKSGLDLAEGELYKATGMKLYAEAMANSVIALPHLEGEDGETDSFNTRRKQGFNLAESIAAMVIAIGVQAVKVIHTFVHAVS